MGSYLIYCSAASVRLSNFKFNTNSLKKGTTSSYVKDTSSYIVRKQSGTIQNHGNMMVKLVSKDVDGAGRESQTACSTKPRL